MNYRNLGNSGLQVSELSFGSWITFGNQIDDSISTELMKIAYDNGINFFDNAEVYAHGKSEDLMGNIIKKLGWQRDSYIVSSKVFFGIGGQLPTQKGLNRKHVVEACHAALKRLHVDYLDLYFCHRPDKNTPIEETVFTMHNLIMQGKILYWGTSEWSAQEITEAYLFARENRLIPPVMEQPQYNLFTRQRFEVEYHRLFKNFKLGTTIWSPLASGLLTGKYNAENTDPNSRLFRDELAWLKDKTLIDERFEKVAKLKKLSNELGISTAQLSIAWCLKNQHVSTVILGASKPEQLQENLKAAEAQSLLTAEVMEKIEAIMQNKPAMPVF
jgi:voltage-dependent potassium channel beta subunit